MVLTHTTNHTYSHPFPTVTLAFFLRYYSPRLNPFSSHVLSTDTISSHVDPETGRLHTTRIHMKKTRLPSAVVKLLPSSVTGGGGDKSSYVLETSVVDIKEGEQHYSTTPPDQATTSSLSTTDTARRSVTSTPHRPLAPNTYVTTTFSYRSTLGGKKHEKVATEPVDGNDEPGTRRFGDWISGWGAKRIQRSIESIASNKTDDQIIKSRDGMRIVLERLRSNGVVAVLRELRRREGNVFEQ
ncbi:hypothetical protein Daesc_007167 [Daldinia eschscholtzii]|uniref:PRELI/MSF1 domain-containing protein n=1 Tax=Daldinia eschscholtzii TaxID=292717 RepID=A0AAX6MDV1_9PEZI